MALPDLRAAVDPAPGWPERWQAAAAAVGAADAVLGFSGAGVTLPAVALAVGARAVVWVDALVRGGRIPDWTTWCPTGARRPAPGRAPARCSRPPGSHLDVAVLPERVIELLG